MRKNPLLQLHSFGQSVWMDEIRRQMLSSGELRKMIREDGLRGVTSNPTIFKKAILTHDDYDEAIRALAEQGKSAAEIYEILAVEDVQGAADLLRPVYEQSEGHDGFVSLEVSPHLAYDTPGTVNEACRLWTLLDRPNVLIKVPATRNGLPAIRQLLDDGVSVNVTLLFGLDRYREVAEAYVSAMESRAAQNKPLSQVASVASFFLSRIDVLVDPLLEKVLAEGAPNAEVAGALRGQIAIASAKVADQIHKEVFSGARFGLLAAGGCRSQRLLWASTGTKNPAYSDIKYIEPLIGPETINSMPLHTLNLYREKGRPALRLQENVQVARQMLGDLKGVGIDLKAVTRQLEKEGVRKFADSYDDLLAGLEEKIRG